MCRVGMGRAGYVPSWLCAEFAMCRVDPAPLILYVVHTHTHTHTHTHIVFKRRMYSFFLITALAIKY